jgi:hypothetical protein
VLEIVAVSVTPVEPSEKLLLEELVLKATLRIVDA